MASTRKASAPSESWIALLGRRDEPTDGVEDYCTFLGEALARRGVRLEQVRVRWGEDGWLSALRRLWSESRQWRGEWVLLQYTALTWSRRGFPLGALAVLAILRSHGVRCAIMFHDLSSQGGVRCVDRLRGTCQDWVIHELYRGATRAIFPDSLETIGWLPEGKSKATFIPIGASIPELPKRSESVAGCDNRRKTIAVFCVTNPPYRERELGEISHAVRFAVAKGINLRIIFVGRGTTEAQKEIDRTFVGIAAEVLNLGLRSASEVSCTLTESDVMLCVRGNIYPRRSSAIAGIACGLPIVGYAGPETVFPVTEAGLELAPYGDRERLASALTRVLVDDRLRQELQNKSLRAYSQYFSWERIADRFLKELSDG